MSGGGPLGIPADAVEAARWLAWRALRRGRHATAERLLRGCAALDPHDAWTWRALATLAFASGDFDSAQDAAWAARALAPRCPESRALAARAEARASRGGAS